MQDGRNQPAPGYHRLGALPASVPRGAVVCECPRKEERGRCPAAHQPTAHPPSPPPNPSRFQGRERTPPARATLTAHEASAGAGVLEFQNASSGALRPPCAPIWRSQRSFWLAESPRQGTNRCSRKPSTTSSYEAFKEQKDHNRDAGSRVDTEAISLPAKGLQTCFSSYFGGKCEGYRKVPTSNQNNLS